MAKGEYFSSKMSCQKGTERAAMPSAEFDASCVIFFFFFKSILLSIRMSVFKKTTVEHPMKYHNNPSRLYWKVFSMM